MINTIKTIKMWQIVEQIYKCSKREFTLVTFPHQCSDERLNLLERIISPTFDIWSTLDIFETWTRLPWYDIFGRFLFGMDQEKTGSVVFFNFIRHFQPICVLCDKIQFKIQRMQFRIRPKSQLWETRQRRINICLQQRWTRGYRVTICSNSHTQGASRFIWWRRFPRSTYFWKQIDNRV